MLCKIDDFNLADGTLAGGWALSGLRVSVKRILDIVVPIGAVAPVVYDREKHLYTFDFEIARVHSSTTAAELYVADHDAAIPSRGTVQFITTGGFMRDFVDADLIQHARIGGIGRTTVHAYHIEGGRRSHFRLLETLHYRLLENFARRLLER